MSVREWKDVAKERLETLIDMQVRAEIAEIRAKDAQARAEAAEARVKVLEEAAKHLVFLHACEQEGLDVPTPKEWFDAVDALSKALAAKEKP